MSENVSLFRCVEGALRYPGLFRLGWSLFFAGSLYLGWNSVGIILVLVHLLLERRTISRIVKTSLQKAQAVISLGGRHFPLLYILAVLGCSGLVSSLMAIQPGRATAALVGMLISMAFGLVFGLAYQLTQPGWFLACLWPSVVGGAAHAVWALWLAYEMRSDLGFRVATVSGPNYTGTMMLLAVIVGLPWFLSQRDWRKWLGVPYTLAVVTALVFTYSRGSWLGLLAFGFTALIPAWRHPFRRRYGQLVLVGTFVFAILLGAYVPGVAERTKSFLQLADDGRVGIYKASWEMFLDHFWFGVGPANFEHYWDEYNQGRVEGHISFPHNTWFQVLTETGIIGGVLFALIIGRVLLAVWRIRKGSDWPLWILASGVVALLVRDQTDAAIFNINTSFFFWWMAGTVLAAEFLKREEQGTAS